MADNDLAEKARAAVASEGVSPELKKRAMDYLASSGAPSELPEQPKGFDYASYKRPKSGDEIVGEPYTMPDDELVNETLAISNDIDQNKRSESKRSSLYAEPLYEGKKGIGAFTNSPFTYFEPKPEFLTSELATYRSKVPPEQQKVIDVALADLAKGGKDSKTYKEAADRLWLETRAEFERDGVPVQRVKHAPADGYRTGVNKVAGNIAAPMLYGADQAMSFGLGSALWPTASQDVMSGTSPEQKKVLERLRQRGVLPTEEESRGQEYDPVLSALGGLSGILAAPMSLGGQAAKAGVALEANLAARAPAFLRGTGLASRMARSAVGGAASAGLAGTGTQAVTEGFEAANGGEASLGDVVDRGTTDALLGGAVGAGATFLGNVPGMLAKGGKYMQERLRVKPGVGDDLKMLEETGGNTSFWKGVERSPEGETLAKESLTPTRTPSGNIGTSQQQAAIKPIANQAASNYEAYRDGMMERMENEVQKGYKRFGTRTEKPVPLFNALVEKVRSQLRTPFASESPYAKALAKVSEIKPMRVDDPALHGKAQFSTEELAELGLDPEAILQAEFRRPSTPGNPNKISSSDRKNIVFTVEVAPKSAADIDNATRSLGDIIKFGKDPSTKDRELNVMYDALVKTRKLFGPAWAQMKANHEQILQSIDDDAAAIGLSGKDVSKLGKTEVETSAYNAFSNYGKPGSVPAANEALEKSLRASPEMGRRLRAHTSNEAYNRLSSGQGAADITSKAGLARSALSGAALHFDPIYGAIGKAGSKVDSMGQNAAIRSKMQELVGPSIELPDSVVGFVANLMNTAQTATRKP